MRKEARERMEDAEEILFDAMRKVAEELLYEVSDEEIETYIQGWSNKEHGEEISLYAPVIAETILSFFNLYVQVRRIVRRVELRMRRSKD